jgi:hypothetical protein
MRSNGLIEMKKSAAGRYALKSFTRKIAAECHNYIRIIPEKKSI